MHWQRIQGRWPTTMTNKMIMVQLLMHRWRSTWLDGIFPRPSLTCFVQSGERC